MRVTISSATSRPFRFDGKVHRIFRSDSAYSVRKKPKKTPSATAPCLLRSGALPTVGQPVVQRLTGRGSLVYHPVDLSFLSPLLVYLLLVPVYSPRLDSRQGELKPHHPAYKGYLIQSVESSNGRRVLALPCGLSNQNRPKVSVPKRRQKRW